MGGLGLATVLEKIMPFPSWVGNTTEIRRGETGVHSGLSSFVVVTQSEKSIMTNFSSF